MSESERPIWPVIVVLIAAGYAFYWHWIFGVVSIVVGVVALGWKDRHKGPTKTRRK